MAAFAFLLPSDSSMSSASSALIHENINLGIITIASKTMNVLNSRLKPSLLRQQPHWVTYLIELMKEFKSTCIAHISIRRFRYLLKFRSCSLSRIVGTLERGALERLNLFSTRLHLSAAAAFQFFSSVLQPYSGPKLKNGQLRGYCSVYVCRGTTVIHIIMDSRIYPCSVPTPPSFQQLILYVCIVRCRPCTLVIDSEAYGG